MSDSLSILIETDAPAQDGPPEVQVGKPIFVRVELASPDRLESRAVLVRLRYDITGRGNPESKVVQEERVIDGPWEAGERGRRTVSLRVPESGPISHAGRLFAIEWSIEVVADIKWATDPKSSISIRVLPREASRS